MFNHWDGDLSGSENPENITMDSNKTVIANFTEIEDEGDEDEYTLTINVIGSGSVARDPDQPTYLYGTLVNLTANASWSFGDGTTGFGEKVTHKYSYGRYFVAELTVLDNSGARDTNKTAVFLSVPNRPPSIPIISGPTNGSKDTKYSYVFGSTDPDNDDINYIINWGDGSTNESGFLPSGHYFSMLHSWAESGEYNITVKASDNQSSSSAEITAHIEENILADNIAIVLLGILALIALMIVLMYSKKGKKKK